jgi:RNA polymerase sigma factor (sigma-70 family)
VSFGEPIALRGQVELEEAAAATPSEVRAAGEAQFVERLRTGEAAAFDRLVRERSGDVYALLYRLTEDAEEARDLTQETFLRAFQNISRFRGDADLKTWIYRIAINQARNRWRWWRRRRRDQTVSLDAEHGERQETLSASLPDRAQPNRNRRRCRASASERSTGRYRRSGGPSARPLSCAMSKGSATKISRRPWRSVSARSNPDYRAGA